MTAVYGIGIFPQHAQMLQESGIPAERARAQGIVSVDTKKRLADLGVTPAGRNVPGLLFPMRDKQGSVWGYQYRPDQPRLNSKGKPIKYETPTNQRGGIDVPLRVGPMLDDPTITLVITEGNRKALCGAEHGLCVVSLPGVWNWIGTNTKGGKVALEQLRDIAWNNRRVILGFDSDVVRKPSVRKALEALAAYLTGKGAKVEYLHLPHSDEAKTGLDDYLAEHTVEELWTLVRPDAPEAAEPAVGKNSTPEPEPLPAVEPKTLAETHTVVKKWLGDAYDPGALNATLAAAAAERLGGDPLWLMVVSGSGNAKTEIVQALLGAGATMTSTISTEGALLSGTSKHETTAEATGGLLREIGNRGLLVVKDFTSILSNSGDARAKVLAAFREIHDGRWIRPLGTDGGRTLNWEGRIAVVGAVTTEWDRAHSVISAMGDRFVLVRMDSNNPKTRMSAGRQAISNTDKETQMRRELAEAVGGLIAGMSTDVEPASDVEIEYLLAAANLVTRARTAVEYDFRGNVVDAYAPEMPTRFAKQLGQVVRGAVAIGVSRTEALKLAIRCARDSMPPLRLAIVDDLAANPMGTASDVRKRLNKPRSTVDRQLQALHMLEVLNLEEVPYGDDKTSWHYTLAEGIDPHALNPESSPDLAQPTGEGCDEDTQKEDNLSMSYVGYAESGEDLSGQLTARANGIPTCKHNGCNVALHAPDSAELGLCFLHQDIAPGTDASPY